MSDDLETRVGPLVAAARDAAGLSQADLAAKARIHESSLSNIERGAKVPTLRTLLDLAKALDMPVAHLIPSPVAKQTTRHRFRLEAEIAEQVRRMPDARLEAASEILSVLTKVK